MVVNFYVPDCCNIYGCRRKDAERQRGVGRKEGVGSEARIKKNCMF